MNSELRELFARLGPVRAIDRVPSGSAAAFVLRPADGLAGVKSVTATLSLARRGPPLLRAKRTVEEMIERGRAYIALPTVEDVAALVAELAQSGVAAMQVPPPGEVDVKALRERLGLTQENFALRYGLDLATVRNWEQGRVQPDTAARSLLRVIERAPEAVAEALAAP